MEGAQRHLQRATSTGGAPLQSGAKHKMQQAFSFDFDAVRVHTDTAASHAAAALDARAMTTGTNIVFGAGEYAPGTASGDRLLAAPGDPHQLGDRPFGAVRRQPRHLRIERSGVPGTMTSPRHLAHRRPVHRTVDPRSISFQEHLDRAHIQCAPPPPARTPVIPAGPASTGSAAPPARAPRPDVDNQNLRLLIKLDILDHRVLDAQHSAP
jgi:Domain of unknown function (DUF4157)